MRYSIDTSGLLDAWARHYPNDVFPTFWAQMEDAIENGVVMATDEVREELERKADDLWDWAKGQPALFLPLDNAIQLSVNDIMREFPKLVDERSGRSMAEPFVIALARVHRLTVVTGEKGGTADRPKIPNVCSHYGIPCVPVLHMIRELGWKF